MIGSDMTIFSSNYSATATGEFDIRDMVSYGRSSSSTSSLGYQFSSAGGYAGYGQLAAYAVGAYMQNQVSKLQYKFSAKQHDFAMYQANWQNEMIGFQRQSIGIQAEQTRMAGRSAEVDANLQANLAKINARMAESAAQQALRSGDRQVQAKQLETAAYKSKQRANFAASGIDLTSESAVEVLTSTDMMGEIDANTISANAIRAAWGYRTEGTNSQIAGLAAGANGRMAVANANANAAAVESRVPSYVTPPIASRPIRSGSSSSMVADVLLNGATQMAQSYYQYKLG